MADIQAARKTLNHTDEAPEKKDNDALNGIVEDKETANELSRLKEIYVRYGGDIERIFEELLCSPRKALKHPPKDEDEFARKFYQGFYTDIETETASESKAEHK